jgi:hypothetical protein
MEVSFSGGPVQDFRHCFPGFRKFLDVRLQAQLRELEVEAHTGRREYDRSDSRITVLFLAKLDRRGDGG